MKHDPYLSIQNVEKTYENGFKALHKINLDIHAGEIFALLGPNGAGKTTLISIICGLVQKSSGHVRVGGLDVIESYKQARKLIGLVPQEISINAFESVLNSLNFSRGLFDLPPDPERMEVLLKKLSLWDKRNSRLLTLSGGMKRRLMIAKALAHEPKILFLDEPTAGVDVELRRDMWQQIRELKSLGVTIILTTHYIEEAEVLADRVGVINKGQLIVVEEKEELMKKMANKEVHLTLEHPLKNLPQSLTPFHPILSEDRVSLALSYDSKEESTQVSHIFSAINDLGVKVVELQSKKTSLEDIFVRLVNHKEQP